MTMQDAPWLEGIGAQCPYDNETTRDDFLNKFTINKELNRNISIRSDVLVLAGVGWGVLCCTINAFFATGGMKKHVLLSTVDSNWGEFSDYIINRTGDWENHDDCNGQDSVYQSPQCLVNCDNTASTSRSSEGDFIATWSTEQCRGSTPATGNHVEQQSIQSAIN